jgi:hypothetical protein
VLSVVLFAYCFLLCFNILLLCRWSLLAPSRAFHLTCLFCTYCLSSFVIPCFYFAQSCSRSFLSYSSYCRLFAYIIMCSPFDWYTFSLYRPSSLSYCFPFRCAYFFCRLPCVISLSFFSSLPCSIFHRLMCHYPLLLI